MRRLHLQKSFDYPDSRGAIYRINPLKDKLISINNFVSKDHYKVFKKERGIYLGVLEIREIQTSSFEIDYEALTFLNGEVYLFSKDIYSEGYEVAVPLYKDKIKNLEKILKRFGNEFQEIFEKDKIFRNGLDSAFYELKPYVHLKK